MLLDIAGDGIARKRGYVFCFFWLVTFLIYLPAAKAGFVSDTTGWLQSLREDSFLNYLNRSRFGVKSMYQLTQLNTWVIYQVVGIRQWPWHLLFVTLHAVNSLLLYTLCQRLFLASGIQKPHLPALAGSFLFCISPYVSEVVVWEASFHYLQALLFIFGILLLTQRFQEHQRKSNAIWATLLFFLSTFTHELFYLTPLLVFTLALYYRIALKRSGTVFRQTLLYFSVPQALCFIAHLISFRLVYGSGIAHVGTGLFKMPLTYFLVKPPWYFFHLFAWGRFFPTSYKNAVYDFFRTPAGAILFYGLLALTCLLILARFRKMSAYWKMAGLLFLWLLLAQAILVPLWFPELLLLVGDRYTYLMLTFQWMLIALLIYRIPKRWLQYGVFAVLTCINLYFVLKLNWKWRKSEQVVRAVETSPLLKPGKVKLLLNSPACLQGVPMIGSSQEGEFRLMHNLFFAPPIKDTMLEVAAYNMDWPENGAHAEVMNDSTIKVTLNQWGTWWWLGGFGASSYENQWFRLDMADPGHWYNVILKKPAGEYQLLYQTGKELKEVDMSRKGTEQW